MAWNQGLRQPGVLAALGAAALFGLGTPLAKWLLTDISPWLLAGLLYLGSGVGLTLYRWLRHMPSVHLQLKEGWGLAGALLAILVLGEPVSLPLLIAGALMALGVWLHLIERHSHEHTHVAMEHEHEHLHDEHHQHEHDESVSPSTRHRHWHRHESMTHTHAHFPDAHHRHGDMNIRQRISRMHVTARAIE